MIFNTTKILLSQHRSVYFNKGKDITRTAIDITYKIAPLSTPKLIRNNEKYICTEKFRVNSNQNLSDVWLIYKSEKDNSTWKLTIIERTNLNKAINKELFNNFNLNDKKTAWQYAFDNTLIHKNGAKMDSIIEYEVQGPKISDILSLNKAEVNIEISSDYPLNLSIRTILKNVLKISNNQLDAHCKANNIIVDSKKMSSKFGLGCTVKLCVEKLISMFDLTESDSVTNIEEFTKKPNNC